jgi:hypothetical protein
MTIESYDSLKAWLASRPESVQRLAREFPLDSMFNVNGQMYYLLGYTEQDVLILTPINPTTDDEHYERAMKEQIFVCADHFR